MSVSIPGLAAPLDSMKADSLSLHRVNRHVTKANSFTVEDFNMHLMDILMQSKKPESWCWTCKGQILHTKKNYVQPVTHEFSVSTATALGWLAQYMLLRFSICRGRTFLYNTT